MESDRQRSHQAGFDDHIVKPIDFEQLDRAIRKICMPEELGQNV
jgi:CheY-like chemotaxis protein